MKAARIVLMLLMTLGPVLPGMGLNLDVRVFSGERIRSFRFTVVKGYYHMDAGQAHKTWSRFQQVELKAEGNKVAVYRNDSRILTAATVVFEGAHDENIFRLQVPGRWERDYDDGLKVRASGGDLILINQVDLEHYVGGVVQSEMGKVDFPEYYKIQDIISRTYALKNIRKHQHEGFNLCDAEHCQVYLSRCTLPLISESISVTRGDVIVDSAGNLITAAFHSNSGGQTMASEDVWSAPLPYLRSVEDTFSLKMSKAVWQDTILLSSWLAYLHKRRPLLGDDTLIQRVIRFEQPQRRTELVPGILLKDIRRDWQLRSTFFDIIPRGDTLMLRGRGWGHGVGLSQQGALRMISLGYDYIQVIRFYYQGVRVVPRDADTNQILRDR